MLYLSIDQHRKQLTINIRNEQGDVLVRRQVSTQWDKVREFFTDLRRQSQESGGFMAILEVCGFNDWLITMLREFGCQEIVLVHPTKRATKKTDYRDASALGELLWVNRQRIRETKPVQNLKRVNLPSKTDAENRQLTAVRQRVTSLRTRTLNKIQKILLKHNLQQDCPTKGLQTKKARAWLRELSLDVIDRLELDQLLEQWELWNKQLQTLDEKITERLQEHEAAQVVISMPGVSAYSSLALGSRIGDIKRFPRPGSLANYWGLTPRCRNSGQSTDRLGSISKEGSAQARFILGQLVLHVLKFDEVIRSWYQRIKKRRGSRIARVAVMRRLATIIWHMVKHKETYIVGGTPRHRSQTAAAVGV
ncbi:MAG: IS110 family transposase [Planctomycetaceae bacterium]